MAGTSPNVAAGAAPRPEEFFKEKARQRQHSDWHHYGPEPRQRQQSDAQQSTSDDARGRHYSLTRVPSSPRSSTSSSRSPSPVRRQARGRYSAPQYRRYSRKDSGEYSRDYSRSRSSPRRSHQDEEDESDVPWFKRKELWATVASIAGVAAATWSANATRQSAKATRAAAMASHRSADASHRIADGNDLQTRATVNTAVANGHQDHRGHYLGPLPTDPHAIRPPQARRRSWDRAVNGGERDRRCSPSRWTHEARSGRSSNRARRHQQGLLQQALAKV